MDGIDYFHNEPARTFTAGTEESYSWRVALLLTVVSVALTLTVLVGLRAAGVPPITPDYLAAGTVLG